MITSNTLKYFFIVHTSVESSTAISSVESKSSSYRNSLYSTPKIVTNGNNRSISILDRKIDLVTEGLQPFYKKILRERLSKKNALTVCDYIISNKRENNVGIHNVKLKIQTLVNFSEFIGTSKVFSKESADVTKDDVHMFLERYRKDEKDDPLHKWIGTYNLKLIIILHFFKWLHDPDNPDSKSRRAPGIIAGIKQYRRKEESIYTPDDLWTEEEDLLFLKYVSNIRDRCYHMVSRDTACRPSELLNARISQLNFKTVANGRQYASLVVSGKTGNREVVLTNSLPYLKDWLSQHPLKENPEAYIFCSLADRNRNKRLSEVALHHVYRYYRLVYFPALLRKDETEVPGYDKEHIRLLLKKPFNPYLRRHLGLSQKARQIHEAELRQYSGWSKNSMMHKRYVHWFNNQGSNAVLKAEGLISKEESGIEKLRPVYCSNCNEANTKNAQWCAKCGMILSFAGYREALEEQKQKDDKIYSLENTVNTMQSQIQSLMSAFSSMKEQPQVDSMAKTLYSSGLLVKAKNKEEQQ
jgi:integrase/recombinase XerD